MLQHVSIEIAPEAGGDAVAFWELLILTEGATVPVLGHPAVVVDDFAATLERVGEAGHEVTETRQLWGARRAFAIAPGGHRVELMESPPPATR